MLELASLRRVEAASRPSSNQAMDIALSRDVVLLGLRTSSFVGSLLNLINQGDALFGEASVDLFKLGLTYLVPYCVATYSATSISLRRARHG